MQTFEGYARAEYEVKINVSVKCDGKHLTNAAAGILTRGTKFLLWKCFKSLCVGVWTTCFPQAMLEAGKNKINYLQLRWGGIKKLEIKCV